MSTYTENYSLHQWESTDDFLRTDFNTDFAKIDTALGAIAASASTAQTAATSNAYNIYNLILQNYYESKYTGYKSALLFDGFMDDSNIASLSTALCHSTQVNALTLFRTGQSDITTGYATTSNSSTSNSAGFYSAIQTCTSNGTLTGFTFKAISSSSGSTTTGGYIYYVVEVNGENVLYAQTTTGFTTTATERTISLASYPLCYGDTIRISIRTYGSDHQAYYSASGDYTLGVTMHITANSGTSATWETLSLDTAWSSALAWVRHSGGTLSMQSKVGESLSSATLLDRLNTTTLQGVSCQESSFQLDMTEAQTGNSFVWQVDLGADDEDSIIFDYGIILLS